MLLKFGAVLSIICGFLMAVLYLDPFTAMYCCCAVVSEDAKTTLASGLQTLSLERESNTVSRCVRTWIKFTLEYPFKLFLVHTQEYVKHSNNYIIIIFISGQLPI